MQRVGRDPHGLTRQQSLGLLRFTGKEAVTEHRNDSTRRQDISFESRVVYDTAKKRNGSPGRGDLEPRERSYFQGHRHRSILRRYG